MPTFTNQAVLSYNGLTTASNTVTGELIDVLSVSKTSLVNTYTSGQNMTYVISLVNTGNTDFTNLTVTDNLGAYSFGAGEIVPLTYVPGSIQYYADGALQPQPAVTAGPPLVVTGIRVPANGNASIVYEANVNEFAPLGTGDAINNSVSVTGASVNEPLTAAEAVTAADNPALTISKAMNPTTVSDGDTLTYTFLLENSGNTAADAASNVAITDNFNPVLNPITVTLNGAPLTQGTDYTYDTATGAFATIPGRITVPAAGFTQNAATGRYAVTPGTSTLVVSGTV